MGHLTMTQSASLTHTLNTAKLERIKSSPPLSRHVYLVCSFLELTLRLLQGGAQTEDEILGKVYQNLSPPLMSFAKSNILLHLKKLLDEHRLPSSFSFSAQRDWQKL